MWNNVLITAEELNQNINNSKLVILDATIDKVNASLKDKELELIPNSRFFDIENEVSDHLVDLPHTLIDEKSFEKYIQKLDITENSTIVIYDRWGFYSAPRAWWTFKSFGFEHVFVLNGGLPAWKNDGFETVKSYQNSIPKSDMTIYFDQNWFADTQEVLAKIEDQKSITVDARSLGRFNGTSPEPRQGLRSGHIPNSCHLFFEDVLDGIFYKSKDELKRIFEKFGGHSNEFIFTCGSGVTASILALAAYSVGYKNVKVYDGSWSEWGKDENLPIQRNLD